MKAKEGRKKDLTRRDFIKTTAVGVGATALTGLGSKEARAQDLAVSWDKEADVVVVGSGCAGLAAAIEAADCGAEVVVLEKMKMAGGTTAMSGGLVAVPTRERLNDAIAYYMACGRGKVSLEMVQTWAEEALKLKEWLEGFGQINVAPRPGYHQGFAGWDSLVGLSPPGAGPVLISYLLSGAQARGVEILLETPALELITTRRKEVVGVAAESRGWLRYIKARKGVVLAAGGIGYNEELKVQFQRSWPKYGTGSPGCTGDGLVMGQALGAALWKTPEGCGRPCIKIPEYEVAYGFGLLSQPCIIVNKYGQRFTREDLSYDAFHMALDSFDAAKREFPNIPFFAIFDEEQRARARVGSPPRVLHGLPDWSSDNSVEIEKGWIIKGETISDLATKIGIDWWTLEVTVAKYNLNCVRGQDPEFGRTVGLKPIKTPPFYAVKGYPGYYGTWAGLKINRKAQVIDVYGSVIPRLYAAGENAIGALGYHYPSGGNCISDGLAFGRIAGRNAAAEGPLR